MKDKKDIDVLPCRTMVYAHPDGPTRPAYSLIKGRLGKLHPNLLEKFRELDPDGTVKRPSTSLEDQDETNELDQNEDIPDQDEKKNETESETEDEEEEEVPVKKTKFLGKKGKGK